MSIAVVSCVYGERGYERFIPRWSDHVAALDPRPDHVIVATDRAYGLPAFVWNVIKPCPWLHPQAFYLEEAVMAAPTDWVLVADIDDRLYPDALDGIEDCEADVWATGFRRDMTDHVTPPLTAQDVLAAPTSLIPGSSAFRTVAFWRAGGFLDIAFQDWALWRAMADTGATFDTSGRVNYRYRSHEDQRTAVELTPGRRAAHEAEMLAAEGFFAHA